MVQGPHKASRPPGMGRGRVTTWGPGVAARPGTCQQDPSAAPAPPHWPGEQRRAQAETPQPAGHNARAPKRAAPPNPRPAPQPRSPASARVKLRRGPGRWRTHDAHAGRDSRRCRGYRGCSPREPAGGRFRGGACLQELCGRPGPCRRSASSACFSGQCPGSRPRPLPRARSSGLASRRPTSCWGQRPAEGKRASAQLAGLPERCGLWSGGGGASGEVDASQGSPGRPRPQETPGWPDCGSGLRGRPEDPVR